MKKILLSLSLLATALLTVPNADGVPITGVIGFSGTAQLDGPTTATSSEILAWLPNNVTGIASGSFAGLQGAPVAFASPWFFNSGALNNFWIAGAYTFNLASSSVVSVSGISLTVSLVGTVVSTVAGLDPTRFIGTFTVQDPSASTGGKFYYTESISFGNVPDTGSTLAMMGIAACGLVVARRRWNNMA